MRPLILLVAVVVPLAVRAQPEIVPAEHRVYDWLLTQRVAGVLPEYRHETLPYDRATVRRHLDTLAVHADRLGPSGRFWLDEFRRELFEPVERIHSYVGDGEADLFDPDAERTLAYVRDDDWRFAVWSEGAVEGRAGDDDLRPGGLSRSARLTFEGNWRRRVGLYTSTVNGAQTSGDTRVLAADPLLAPLYYVARDPTNIAGSFDQTSASLRLVGGPFAVEIANERLLYGAFSEAPVVLAGGADYVPFVRLGLQTRSVTFQAVHAALSSIPSVVLADDGTPAYFDRPERYLALHRLEVQPLGWFSAAFTEMAVYGRRGPDLAYLNPLFPVKAAEHASYDRDNTLFSLEATVRPLPRVEAYGTWLVDDLATGSLGGSSYGNKWALQAGGRVRVPFGMTLFGEYVRIEPYTYTHRFVDSGDYFNSYLHNGFGLGHPLGPNADQWTLGLETWLPFRAHARLSGRYTRKGRNPIDPATGEPVQVGGDVRNGAAPPDGRKQFLAGDLYQGPGLRSEVEVEPARGVALRFYGDVQWWQDREADIFLRLGLAIRP